jgi:hypothetical protein
MLRSFEVDTADVGTQLSTVLQWNIKIWSENNKLILLSTNDKAERGKETDKQLRIHCHIHQMCLKWCLLRCRSCKNFAAQWHMEHDTFDGSTYQFHNCDTYGNRERRDANTRHSVGVQKVIFNGMRMRQLCEIHSQ